MIAAGGARDAEHVDVGRLAELLVQPDDHRDVALEVAEPPAAAFGCAPGSGLCSHCPSPAHVVRSHRPKFEPIPFCVRSAL